MSTKRPHGLVSTDRKRIGELLVEEGVITERQLQEALALQSEKGGKLVENLIKLNFVDIRTFVNFVSRQPGVASIDLRNYEVPRDLVNLIPCEFAVKHEVFPIDKLGKLLTVGMVCPLDKITLAELEKITGLRVKALLCSAEDIHATIRLHYRTEGEETSAIDGFQQIGSALRMENVASLIRRIDDLPALPMTVRRVKELMDDPESPMQEVAKAISLDPPICARVLRMANSAAYGFPRKVDNVNLAISLLGLKEIFMVVLSSAVMDQFKQSKTFDYESFWRTSLFCATAAKEIARASGREKKTGVFTQGLLANIGQLVFMQVATERYATIPRNLSDNDLIAAEEKTLGIAHPEAGYVLATHWDLPDELATAIRFHHTPHLATEHTDAAATLALASRMTEMNRTLKPEEIWFDNEKDLITPLRLDPTEALEVYQATVEHVAQESL